MGDAEEQLRKILSVVGEAIAKGAEPIEVTCPHCKEKCYVNRKAIYQDNKLTFSIHMKDGHRLQASTLGGTMVNMSKLMKAAAKELGAKVEVLVGDMRVKNNVIEVDYMSVLTEPPTEKRESLSGAVAGEQGVTST